MRINQLSIKGFGKWRDADFRFAPGLNLFFAPNEAGKSTLLQAVFASLYGLKRDYVRSARYLPEYDKYLPWHSGSYELAVLYEVGGKRYRLHRRLEKEREQGQVFLDPDWTEVTHLYQEDRRKERNFLELHLGLSRSLFTDVTWVRRSPLEASEYLLPSLFGSSETDPAANRMLAALDKELALIGKKERAENTQLGKAGALVAQRERELAEAEAAWAAVQKLTQQIALWEHSKKDIERKRDRLKQRLIALQREEQAWQKRWQESYREPDEEGWQQWEKTARTEEERMLHREVQSIWAALEHPGETEQDKRIAEFPDPADLEKLESAYRRGAELRKARDDYREHADRLAEAALRTAPRRSGRGGKRHGNVRLWWAGCFASLIAAAVFLFAGYAPMGWVAAGVSAACATAAVVLNRGRTRQSENQLAGSQHEWRAWQDKAARCDEELHQLLQEWNASDWDAFLIMREERKSLAEGREASLAAREWRRQEERTSLIKRWGEALRSLLEQEQFLREQERTELEREAKQLDQELLDIRERIARAAGELGKQDEVSLAKVRGDYEEAIEALRQLQLNREALTLARDTLQQALHEWNKELSPAVNRVASDVMAKMTGGKYEDVRLDPQEQFGVKVWDKPHQRIVEHDFCSSGTQDQLYFAQRVALHRHVSQQTEPLPLFLDDHFVHYDPERLERALHTVMELAEDYQIFLFTCTDRESRLLQPFLHGSGRHRLHALTEVDSGEPQL
ncbi:ATP-binding protein [Brevibacillus borstelensis]|uniref:ATP-binding protein n=1 Tax=Brevibacillus borstelensis TaxID=45462 RepID=UPI0030C42904